MPQRHPTGREQGLLGQWALLSPVPAVSGMVPHCPLLCLTPTPGLQMPPGPSPPHLGPPPFLEAGGNFLALLGKFWRHSIAQVGMNDLFFLSQHIVNPGGRLNMPLVVFIPADEAQLGSLKEKGVLEGDEPSLPPLSRPPRQVGGTATLGSP